MFMAALSTVTKVWKECKCPPMHESTLYNKIKIKKGTGNEKRTKKKAEEEKDVMLLRINSIN
jgi:hypothetical protein